MRFFIIFFISAGIFSNVQGQVAKNLDGVVAVIGDRYVLKSEVYGSMADMAAQGQNMEACDIMEQLIAKKILAEQADRDSIVVSDEEVEGNLDNRIRYFIQQYGTKEQMEEVIGKTIYQLKDEYRPVFKEQMLAERMQQQLISNVRITPQEVTTFFNKIEPDSLPFYPSSVQVGQIFFKPVINKEVMDYAREKLEDIRQQIVNGTGDFETLAGIYSEDPGSRDAGGSLGFVTREDMVPEFSSAAFRLQVNEISGVVKTEFGYHIIQMMERQGERAKLRHILVKPQITSIDIKNTTRLADSVRAELMTHKITFSEAVSRFSEDKMTKMTGGMISVPATGQTTLMMDQLDPPTALLVQEMEVGDFSQPQEYTSPYGDKGVRILYLRSRTEPHKANLKDDYNQIQEVALGQKQNEYLANWMTNNSHRFYVRVNDEFQDCENIQRLKFHNSKTNN